jgi:hypothetical protein
MMYLPDKNETNIDMQRAESLKITNEFSMNVLELLFRNSYLNSANLLFASLYGSGNPAIETYRQIMEAIETYARVQQCDYELK